MKRFCEDLDKKIDQYETLLTENRIWVGRTKGVGVLSADDAIALGVTGPVLRASGVEWDVRKAMPYAAYERYQFDIPTRESGDTYDRYLVRMEEMRQSRQSVCKRSTIFPKGPIMARIGKVLKPPPGEVYHSDGRSEGRVGLLHRERRNDSAVSRARAAAFIFKFAGVPPNGTRRDDCGRGRDHRLDRYRAGRGGSLMQAITGIPSRACAAGAVAP